MTHFWFSCSFCPLLLCCQHVGVSQDQAGTDIRTGTNVCKRLDIRLYAQLATTGIVQWSGLYN